MYLPIKKGFSFGLTSGVITTLGLIVGLQSGTQSMLAVIGGVITIAVADAFSDALGMHISQETEIENSKKDIWLATFFTFLTKFFIAMTFLVPILLLSLNLAVIVSVIWGLALIAIFSYYIAKSKKIRATEIIFEHITIALLVVIITHYLGDLINSFFI